MANIDWIKIYTRIFEDEKIKFIERLKERDVVLCIWFKLLIQAAKTNSKGIIFLSPQMPYTNEMFSILFNRPLNIIKYSFKILSDFQMIEIDDNNFIKICNWEKYQNVEGMERVRSLNRKRAERHREKNKQIIDYELEGKNNICENELENNFNNDESEINKTTFEKNSNVTKTTFKKNSNVTVTLKRERENKIENENKNKIKREIDNKIKNKSEKNQENLENMQQSRRSNDAHENSLSLKIKKEKSLKEVDELLNHYKNRGITIGGLNLSSLEDSISIHGKINAKAAIDKALELNKPDMKYINGILGNWKREGYPSVDSLGNGIKSGNSRSLRFNNFKPREYDYENLEKALLGWNK